MILARPDRLLKGCADSMKKAQIEERYLGTCLVCEGQGEREVFLGFNPASNDQAKEVLYNVLKLPVKRAKGKVTTDEKALKAILGSLQA